MRKKLLLILLSLAALMIWGSGIHYGQYIKEYYQSVSIRLKQDGITAEELITGLQYEEIKNTGNTPSISAWNGLEEQIITSTELGHSYQSWLIEVYGDIGHVFPLKLMAGNLLTPNDYEGCILDEETAYQLFGTINPIGNSITYKDNLYYIRGIIKSPKPVFFLMIENRNHRYYNIELVYEKNGSKKQENGQELANSFLLQNNLATSYTMIDGPFYSELLEILSNIPAWFLGFYMLYSMLQILWERRTLPLQMLILLSGFLVLRMFLKWLLDFQISIPERLIPTKWSDFSFWSEKYRELREQIDSIAYLSPTIKDNIFISYARRCVNDTLISLISMWVLTAHIKIIVSKIKGIPLITCTLLLQCISVFILYTSGKEFLIGKEYFFILPLFIIGAKCRTLID